jgi:hypothetical protein
VFGFCGVSFIVFLCGVLSRAGSVSGSVMGGGFSPNGESVGLFGGGAAGACLDSDAGRGEENRQSAVTAPLVGGAGEPRVGNPAELSFVVLVVNRCCHASVVAHYPRNKQRVTGLAFGGYFAVCLREVIASEKPVKKLEEEIRRNFFAASFPVARQLR